MSTRPSINQVTYNLPGSGGTNTDLQIASADFNGDSKTDVLVTNRTNVGGSPSSLLMLPGDGKGNLGTPITSSINVTPTMVIAADMNNDHKPDAVVIGQGIYFSPKVSVVINQGNGTFAAEQDYTVAAAVSLAVGDFNGDGFMDVAVAEGSTGVFVLLGQSDGTLGTAKLVDASNTSDVVAGSLTGDGRTDLIVVDAGSAGTPEALHVHLGNADGSFTAATAPTTELTASASTITVGASVTFTATVAGPSGITTVPTGTVTFTQGMTTLGMGTLSATGVATLATTALPTGSDSITAVYGGDTNFAGNTSSAVMVAVNAVVVNPTFALSNSGNITVAAGAATANSATISVTGAGGFSGAVALTCAVTPAATNDPATCRLSPASLPISGAIAQTSPHGQ